MRQFGLIGYPLGHSFSKKYFAEKFQKEGIRECAYENYPLQHIGELPALLSAYPLLEGINVTIPYKQQVIPFLHDLSDAAATVQAVNCIDLRHGNAKGYNTDVIGFEKSLLPLLTPYHTQALVLGTGGAARAVAYVLRKLNIAYEYVSRRKDPSHHICTYDELDAAMMEQHTLIINTTPLGMYPQVNTFPDIPYDHLNETHLLYDLVYNPSETLFLQKGAERKAAVKNGHEMLILQAEASWEIWNDRLAQ